VCVCVCVGGGGDKSSHGKWPIFSDRYLPPKKVNLRGLVNTQTTLHVKTRGAQQLHDSLGGSNDIKEKEVNGTTLAIGE